MKLNKILIGVTSATLLASALFIRHGAAELNKIDNEIVDYNEQISILEASIADLEEELQSVGSELTDAYKTLDRFVESLEYDVAAVPYYSSLPIDKDIQTYTYNLCRYYDIEQHYELVLAVMWQESHFNPDTISKTNDYGIMQINKCNHDYLYDTLGIVDIMDIKDNIHAGVYILSTQLKKYEASNKALMAYNMGPSGAASLWDRGIYNSSYSEGVLAKAELIANNNYK